MNPEECVRPLRFIACDTDAELSDLLDACWRRFYADLAGAWMPSGEPTDMQGGTVVVAWSRAICSRYADPICFDAVPGGLVLATRRMLLWGTLTVRLPEATSIGVVDRELVNPDTDKAVLEERVRRARRLIGQAVDGVALDHERRLVNFNLAARAVLARDLPASWRTLAEAWIADKRRAPGGADVRGVRGRQP